MPRTLKFPDIYHYLNYRAYLRDRVEYWREKGEFSNRQFAKKVGFKSTAHLRLILRGKRNLSEDSTERLATALELKGSDKKFFKALVAFEQAKTSEEQEQTYQDILKFKKFMEVRTTSQEEYEYFSNWYTAAIFEGLGSHWRNKTLPEMARSLSISEAKVKKSLDLMETLGLVSKKRGRWERKHSTLEALPEAKNVLIRSFYRQMLQKGLESMDEVAPDQRHLLGLTISLKRDSYDQFNKKMAEFIRDFNVAHSDERDPDAVYQIIYQIFPLIPLK